MYSFLLMSFFLLIFLCTTIRAFGKYYSTPTVTMFRFRNSTMKTFFLALVAVLILEISAQWKNNWDGPLDFQCPSNKSYIYQIVSIHNNKKEDRLFDFSCLPVHEVSGPVSCSLSGIFLKMFIFSLISELKYSLCIVHIVQLLK